METFSSFFWKELLNNKIVINNNNIDNIDDHEDNEEVDI